MDYACYCVEFVLLFVFVGMSIKHFCCAKHIMSLQDDEGCPGFSKISRGCTEICYAEAKERMQHEMENGFPVYYLGGQVSYRESEAVTQEAVDILGTSPFILCYDGDKLDDDAGYTAVILRLLRHYPERVRAVVTTHWSPDAADGPGRVKESKTKRRRRIDVLDQLGKDLDVPIIFINHGIDDAVHMTAEEMQISKGMHDHEQGHNYTAEYDLYCETKGGRQPQYAFLGVAMRKLTSSQSAKMFIHPGPVSNVEISYANLVGWQTVIL